ncbi:hypothetical protein IH824_06485 [candidate division KSB1 bacterium]|nr:hypothetical protein [candidate division KSB1 bacterium]
MHYYTFLFISLFLLNFESLFSQNETLDDIHLFQTFFRDARIADAAYGQATLGFSDFDGADVINIGVTGAIPINPQFEIGGSIAFLNVDPNTGNGESGFSDLRMTGRYHFQSRNLTKITAGGFLTLPIGKDELGQGEINLGVFGAVRHPIGASTVLTGTLSLDFLKGGPVGNGGWPALSVSSVDRETALLLGGGIIHQINTQLSFVGELNLVTEGEFGMISGGLDYKLQSGGRLRGTLGLGLDDGAPDLAIVISFLHFFEN